MEEDDRCGSGGYVLRTWEVRGGGGGMAVGRRRI